VSSFDLSTIKEMEPADFARLVKSTPDATISDALSGEHRGAILDEIFGRFPRVFRADRAGATNTVIHWEVGGAPDGGSDTYQLVIADGACTVSSDTDREPRLTVILSAVDFLKMVTGNANPTMMFMTGKLKAKGDLGLAASIASLFDLPKP
jgi:hypothetical protein